MNEQEQEAQLRAHNERYEATWEAEGYKLDALMERGYTGTLQVYAMPDSPRGKRIRAMQAAEKRSKKQGDVSRTQRFRILRRDGFRCQLCGRSYEEHGVVLEVDHKISRADGGTNHDDNLHSTCFDCNRGKGRHSL